MTTAPCHSPNPFATGTADDLRDLLVRHLSDGPDEDGMRFWRARTTALVEQMSPVLVWLRDHKGIQINTRRCYAAFGLREIATLWDRKVVLLSNPGTGTVQEVDAGDLPPDLHSSLRAYLATLPGYDPSLLLGQQSEGPYVQHSYVLWGLHQGLARSAPASRAA